MEKGDEIHVLYVDDEENNLNAFKASFRRDFKVYTAISADDAKVILKETEIHVLITDQRMPGTTGTELLAQAVKDFPDQTRILLTGFSDIEALKDAINLGQIFCYLQKPWNDDELKETIKRAYQVFNLKKEKEALTEKLLLTNEQLEFYLRQKLLS
ncbi:MAG: response regulator with CheY-like receiver, AAA-type ATPase, and DNA-binding domain [Chitinophagaceae bacterium]|nr:response regulator with CheY-like receiver, AAA-type ATPase, and DNA-binding domain [Chitinophagaceae bacterium]